MSDITVKLNISPGAGEAAVTCEPPGFSANRGNQQIKWKPGGSQGFSFTSLTGLSDDPPFSNLNVSGNEITIDDDDTSAAEYPYTIWVTSDANGQPYSTIPVDPAGDTTDPCIKNK